MPFKQKYNGYRKRFDKKLEFFFKKQLAVTKKIDNRSSDLVLELANFILSGGAKRLRPIMVQIGYELVGGKINSDAILDIGMSVEMYHSWLLIHDDFIDRDEVRHNRPTVHISFEKLYRKRFKSLSTHYGASFAILAGDLASVLAGKLFEKANFLAHRKESAKKVLFENLELTVCGEFLDIYGCSTKKEAWKVAELKTAYYSFVNPLVVGAILGGATQSQLKILEKFGRLVGVTFQLRDDIIGLFGDSKQTGKEQGADVREKKNTPLIYEARRLANYKDKVMLDKIWQKKIITLMDIKNVKSIVEKSGSLEYNQKIAQKFVKKGKEELSKIKGVNQKSKEFLMDLANYVALRDK